VIGIRVSFCHAPYDVGTSHCYHASRFPGSLAVCNPNSPGTIATATGEQCGAYFLFAGRYRELLAAEGIELQIRHIATWTLVSGLVATFSRNRMATYQRKLSVRWSPA